VTYQPHQSEDLTLKCLPHGVMFDAFGEQRVRYIRVVANGSTCICDEVNVREYKEDEARNPGSYVFEDVWLSEREFDDLPEFDGF
jgi:hypothetical protein